MSPVLLVIAGPNGAGKTTVTERLRRDHWSDGVEYLNPDEVAQHRFGGWNDPASVLEAARWTTERREALLAARQSLAFETVFSTPDKLAFVERAREAGYFIRLFFIGTSDPAINASRVAQRYMRGGHTVPIEKIVDRYARSMANLAEALPLVDRAYLFDNSIDGAEATMRVRCAEGCVRKVYDALPTWCATALDGLPHHERFEDLRAPSP